MSSRLNTSRAAAWGTALFASALALTACSGAGGGAGDSSADSGTITELTLATVNNPQMVDMEQLKGEFEADHPDIKVNFIQMEENDLRDAVTKDIATQGGQYDILTIGAYEVRLWQQNDWIVNLSQWADDDAEYDIDDLFPPVRTSVSVDDDLYAAPFYGESSFLMYNRDIISEAGITVPERPTWQEVAAMAKQVDTDDHAGICLRGKPGWGEGIASLNTVVNTFGGSWFDMDWNAQVDQEGFRKALTFWSETIRDSGEADPVSYGFTECLNLFTQGKAAFWYDATSAAGSVEDPDLSEVAGNVGYVHAPVVETDESGWLWSWNLAIPKTSQKQEAAWEFIKWATGKDYASLVGNELGWSRVPPGARLSTYDIPEYQEAAGAFADITKETMLSVNPEHPGVNPQPYVGIQFITIPEWQDLGNSASQVFAEVYAGRKSVDDALAEVQELAQKAGDAQK
ncbi:MULTISPECIES: ABC transporter substrate-binding protein [unclassified Pseudactinotalea]|uniref:ABC transporter substrate-binding protein n=1 Tax=unclassified Pseudactinotalea TaxID=2649176 RepID=UPI00128B6E3D|nr:MULTISPECIES: sugar ABC transporter substrate-binding protein [unclassified Pseudactinotalea]MPV49667.1 extracellular solute-binding protein [Pseudactinotalea sp. HY160]QGH69647.1 extracellular solute-binding protein [Pseudactinotalea sp. HY158]